MLVYRQRPAQQAGFDRPEGMPPVLHALLCRRGVCTPAQAEAFLHPGLAGLNDPFLLAGMDAAVARLRAAIAADEPICVYGDYDVDGVCATAILLSCLKAQGARARHYLPDRHREGYGLNAEAVASLAESGVRLLVTVDCGVNAVEPVALARQRGMDVIVTDHHRPDDARLPDCTLVNPLMGQYPCAHLSGAGVALKICEAMLGREAALEYIDLAALSTVADVVPLTGENRDIVALGLQRMNQAPRKGIAALRRRAALGDKPLTAGHLGFQIGPRLNAGGRLGSAQRALELLLCEDERRCAELAEELEAENLRRRELEGQILSQAEEALQGFDFPAHRAIVLAREGWNTGILGLAASRLAEKYHYPTILLAREGETLKGSCRSIGGVDIFEAIQGAGEFLLRFGGHRQAAGLTLRADRLAPFCAALEAYLWKNVPAQAYIPVLEYDLEADFSLLDAYAVAALEQLQPTGMGNPAPVLRARGRVLEARRVGRDGAHLRLRVDDGAAALTGVMFSAGDREAELAGEDEYDLLFSPRINAWSGRATVEIELRALEPVEARRRISPNPDARDALVVRFLTEMLYNREIEFAQGAAVGVAELRAALDARPQGWLIVAWDEAQARFVLDALGDARLDVIAGKYPRDARAFNALCLLPAGEAPVAYARVLDAGQICGAPACAWLAQLPDVEQMRLVYRLSRSAMRQGLHSESLEALASALTDESGMTRVGVAAALMALEDMRLMAFDGGARLLPPQKRDPQNSDVVRRILRLRAHAREGSGRDQ